MHKILFLSSLFLLVSAKSTYKAVDDAQTTETTKTPPPNILIIMADDLTFKDLSLYGGTNVNTPNINKLASQSMVFNKAYVSMAMCTPSRSEFFTGLYPLKNGVAYNHGKAKEGTKSIVQHLDKCGYRTGIAGKIHVSPESVFAFEKVDGIERDCVSKTADYDNAGMQEFVSRNDKPFCLLATLVVPHFPWTVGDYTHFDQDKLVLPPYMADTPETRKCYAQYLAEVEVLDEQVGKTLDMLEKTGKANNTIVIFTSEQGSQFPMNKWTNWNMGLHTGFMVRWPGKIKPGTRTEALIQYADVLPTLLEIAGGTTKDAAFDGTSFYKVLTGEKTSHRKYAYALHHNIPEGPEYPIRSVTDGTYHYIRNLKSDNLYIEKHLMAEMQENLYWPSWVFKSTENETIFGLVNKYMKRPDEELYNMGADEFELNNLADDPKYAQIKESISKELDQWMQQQNDEGAVLDSWQSYKQSKSK